MSAVDNFLLDLKEPVKSLAIQVHDILMIHQGVTSKIKWRIPVYYTDKYFCYVNPIYKKSAVELCFVQGFRLEDPSGLLEARKRKMIKGILIKELSDDLVVELNQLIIEAIELNRTLKK